MKLTRRQVCVGLASVGAQHLLGCSSGGSKRSGDGATSTTTRAVDEIVGFDQGVATFDPSSDGFLLWTRVRGSEDEVDLEYVVARDAELRDIVVRGDVTSDPDADHTAVADVTGLDPATTYYYALSAGATTTTTGRTRTLPDGATDSVRLAIVSCSNYAYGYFAAYAELARRTDIDAVVHLGDYVYEFGPGTYDDPSLPRAHQPPREAVTLVDYRTRYLQYRSDPDLQELHRQHPMLAIWDDHEFADDAFATGAGNHQSNEGDWADRKVAASQAYSEWVPIRRRDDGGIYRSVRFGDLVELTLLDTRHAGRDPQPSLAGAGSDPGRALLGGDQEAWLADTLRATATDGIAWRLLGQQVMVAPLTLRGRVLNVDQWDGYPTARSRLLDLLEEVDDSVVLTGDIHSSWAMDVPRDVTTYDPVTGAGSVVPELVTPGVTSPALEGVFGLGASEAARLLDHVHWADLRRRGFIILDVARDRVQADWYHLDNVKSRDRRARFARGFVTRPGTRRLEPAPAPLTARPGADLAP